MVERTHFPGLNALRFYAALAVVYLHIDQNLRPRPFLAQILRPFLIDAGSAVNLFFVLSGFLITYLLLREQAANGDVAVGKFYLRRMLRIWPLYYFVVILGLLVFPLVFGPGYSLSVFSAGQSSDVLPVSVKLILAFLLLPNFASISAPMIHIWSIGVEEQFYLAWPWVARNKTRILKVCFGILVIKFALAPILPLVVNTPGALAIFSELRFECMAIGALGAYAYFQGYSWLKWCYHPVAQVFGWGAFVCAAMLQLAIEPYTNAIMATAFVVVILNVATNPRSLVRLNHPILERMGRVSYGLYMYHFPFLYLVLRLAQYLSLADAPWFPTVFFVVSLVGTWLVAELSYRWLETPFLNLKDRFTIVRS